MELVMGVGPMNLVITNDALYQLSYTSTIALWAACRAIHDRVIWPHHFPTATIIIAKRRGLCKCFHKGEKNK